MNKKSQVNEPRFFTAGIVLRTSTVVPTNMPWLAACLPETVGFGTGGGVNQKPFILLCPNSFFTPLTTKVTVGLVGGGYVGVMNSIYQSEKENQ